MNLKFYLILLQATLCFSAKTINIDAWMSKIGSSEYKANAIDGIYQIAQEDEIKENEFLYKKYSEVETKWLSTKLWTFNAMLTDLEIYNYEHINLIFNGIDTLCTVFFRGYPIGNLDNMFLQYIFDVKHLFWDASNPIELKISDPVAEAARLYKAHSEIEKLLPKCPPDSYNGDCDVFMLRKMQASFGSNIGPSIPSMGVWRPVTLEAYNDTVIREVIIETLDVDEDNWELEVTVYFANNKRNSVQGTLSLEFQFTNWTNLTSFEIDLKPNEFDEVVDTVSWIFGKDEVQPWWPNEYGEPNLYNLNVSFTSSNGENSWKNVRVGFRKIELIQDDLEKGSSFYIQVNDVPIFIKGAVTLPLSLQPELGQNREGIYKLLNLAREQHMNMIRIWGGGVYESDAFYEIADELGLLVWQDFTFTDYSYPNDYTDFLDNVRDEVGYQIKRIYGHASAAIFCGNDEAEQAIADNKYHIKKSKEYFLKNYIALKDTIENEFDRITNRRGIFLSSTPTNGKLNDDEIDDDRNDLYSGDAHIFNTGKDPFNISSYPIPRFCSAYGVQSLPPQESFLKDTFGNVTDLRLDDEFMKSRQHFEDGFDTMKSLIEHQLDLPEDSDSNWLNYYQIFTYYSQIIQAMSMKIQTELYRSYRNSTKSNHGFTMGTLYWHFNDVWTAPSWSGIDYYGKWKMLQYYAIKFFDPIIITGRLETKNDVTSLNIVVVTDVQSIEKANATINICRWDDLGCFNNTLITKITLPAGSTKVVKKISDLDEFLKESDCSKKDCFLTLTLEIDDVEIAPENFVLPKKLKSSAVISDPNIQFSVNKLPYEEIYEIEVTTEKNAIFVWLDAHDIDGHFTDNGFLQTTPSKRIIFYSDVTTSAEELKNVLTITHLMDQTYFL